MEAEADQRLRVGKGERTDGRSGCRGGCHPRRLDNKMGTMCLMAPKAQRESYIPFFVSERKLGEAALTQVLQEAFAQGASTRKMKKPAQGHGIENLFGSQVSQTTKGLHERVREFRDRSHSESVYPILRVDAPHENVRVNGGVVGMAVLAARGVDEKERGKMIAVEPMAEESKDSYETLFENLKERGMAAPKLVISDAPPAWPPLSGSPFPYLLDSSARSISRAISCLIFLKRTRKRLP